MDFPVGEPSLKAQNIFLKGWDESLRGLSLGNYGCIVSVQKASSSVNYGFDGAPGPAGAISDLDQVNTTWLLINCHELRNFVVRRAEGSR
ncbi:hypothetical protein AVEN_206731-1 [Araneus ventricosus]|uniref:Uncharacterized protein n=1 Tax=Araneus ventricosus TaxID=182803 RepID=A0A4Y2WLT1_ARAVE|nr:hypothetical protein AVEN_206731-1 [Araneus ventricosus]